MYDVDYAIVGSGFGGAVAALRLAEKGYSVIVLEQGRRISKADMTRAAASPRHLLWLPSAGLKGFFAQEFFRHVNVIRGIGVGGGSLVYAAVLLTPRDAFFADSNWSSLADWKVELAPHYAVARHMLGVARNPYWGSMDELIRQTAERMGAGDSVGNVEQGIFFGTPGVESEDPFLAGQGPRRQGCTQCGNCITGCAEGAKNSLDKNYLYLAEKQGARIRASRRVERLEPLAGGGFRLLSRCMDGGTTESLRARNVVLAAGVLGTVELLLRSRYEHGTLPALSAQLGRRVRTNSEAIVAAVTDQAPPDLRVGTTISSHFYPAEGTHITNNRMPASYEFMKWYTGPLIDDARPVWRALRTLVALLMPPWLHLRQWFRRRWHERVTVLTVMQQHDSDLRLDLVRPWWAPWRRRLATGLSEGRRAPSYLPLANQAARALAEVSGGLPLNTLMESVGNVSVTAHILGGCAIGADAASGVVDARHRVFGYPDLLVTDASVIPANIGVNPSLTITAMAERAMSFVPDKAAMNQPVPLRAT